MLRKSAKSCLCLLLLWLGMQTPLYSEDLVESQARLGQVTGDVGLLTQGAVDWIEPKEGLPLEPGDHLRTGDDGRVEIVASDVALWVLEPQSDLLAERVDQDNGRLNLSSGTLIGTVDSARAAGRAQLWEINTPVAGIAIRGTQFAFHFSQTTGARLGVYEGTVEVQPAETAEGLAPPTKVGPGQEAFIPRGKPLKLLIAHSPLMAGLEVRRKQVKRRQTQIEGTWTPFTPTVKSEIRQKYIAPPPKPRAPRPKPPRVRKGHQS